MSESTRVADVLIIGGGLSGTMLAVQLLLETLWSHSALGLRAVPPDRVEVQACTGRET